MHVKYCLDMVRKHLYFYSSLRLYAREMICLVRRVCGFLQCAWCALDIFQYFFPTKARLLNWSTVKKRGRFFIFVVVVGKLQCSVSVTFCSCYHSTITDLRCIFHYFHVLIRRIVNKRWSIVASSWIIFYPPMYYTLFTVNYYNIIILSR